VRGRPWVGSYGLPPRSLPVRADVARSLCSHRAAESSIPQWERYFADVLTGAASDASCPLLERSGID